MNNIVITGGHLTPALAIIEEIQKDKQKWQIYYFGRKYALHHNQQTSFEYNIIKSKKNIKFIRLITGKLHRKISKFMFFKDLVKIPIGFLFAFYYLIKIKPDLIISFGGFLSVPVVITGKILGIPSIAHEQTTTLGLANKINSYFVNKICLSFPILKHKKAILTGNPIAKNILQAKISENKKLTNFIKNSKKPILFITGGKTGSQILNKSIVKIKNKLTKNFKIIHQIGLDPNFKETATENYLRIRFTNNMGYLLKKSDLVISRAGANIVTELATLKTKAILIPIPWSSQNEQYKNAEFLEKTGLARIIEQENLTSKKLLYTINSFYKQKGEIKYPDWFKHNPPEKAAGKIWQLAKRETR